MARTWSTPVADGDTMAWVPRAWAVAPSSWQAVQSGPVRISAPEASCLADCVDGQVQDPGQLDLVPVNDEGDETFQANGLSGTEVVQLCDHAWPGAAQVEHPGSCPAG